MGPHNESGPESGRRTPAGDLWRRTLAMIATSYGRLVYLTSLRSGDTGRYEHHGLALVFGREEAHRAIGEGHSRIFREWLGYTLPRQRRDLEEYMDELPFTRQELVESWIQLSPYRNLCPAEARPEERELFCGDVEIILTLLRSEMSGGEPHPDAWQPQPPGR